MRKSVLLTLKRSNWTPIAVLGLLLSVILVFLYDKTRDYNPSNYIDSMTLVRQIKEIDAHWELDAMKSKIGLNKNYDPLADPINELNKLQRQLASITAGHKSIEAGRLAKSVRAFESVIDDKGVLIEHFKSHDAVLRNSLVFLPTAVEDIRMHANQVRPENQVRFASLLLDIDKVLLAGLLFEENGGAEEIFAKMAPSLERISVNAEKMPTDVRDRVDIFILHIRTILRETTVVGDLLERIVAMPTSARIDDINNILSIEHQRNDEQDTKYRQYIAVILTTLIGLSLYAIFHLIHGHVDNRINTELQHVNDNLERRVEQRTHELGEAQAALVTTARKAGMAEIATNVLHNVGNVLNSVNVSAGLVSRQIRASKLQGLGRAVEMMNDHAADLGTFLTLDPKGKMLPDYLNKLAKAVTTEQQGIIEEMAQLTKSVDHIKDIIAAQQSRAGVSGISEQFDVHALLEDAIRISASAPSVCQVTVVRQFTDVPPLWMDKSQVLEILINLIGNARQAVANNVHHLDVHEHHIILRLCSTQAQTVQIEVVDNGEGIPAENLTLIFAHGFTTRKEGHGFGLHSCVLAAQEMGGSLTVHSDGVGKGATFTLELPIEQKEEVIA